MERDQAPVEIAASIEAGPRFELEPPAQPIFSEQQTLALLEALPAAAEDRAAFADAVIDDAMPAMPLPRSIERRERTRALSDADSATGSSSGGFARTDREIAGSSSLPTRRAVPIEAPSPRYPPPSVRAGEEGTVLCRIHVAADGAVSEVEIIESSGFTRLDQAAREGLLRWRFAPRLEAGVPVASTLLHPVEFVLTTD